ncbi:MAG TPA: TonB-dependent receptor [Vicinamibacterales bacterium]|nr:TonB-dependent receptor [Vicinamibacterales bacterium]
MSHFIRPPVPRAVLGALVALAVGISASTLHAQLLYGSIVGVVKDAQGALIPGATVTIVNTETNLTREATTNAEGAYNFTNVLIGPYDVKVTLTGFREAVRTAVPVTLGQIARVDMTLEIGTLTETVTVASAAELLQTDKVAVSTELKSAELTQMPLNRFRNYQALINLVPGTTPMAFGNAETDTPARSLATNVNGQANTNNSTRTDGATNLNIWLPNHNMYISPAETIDSVNISTSTFDAEQGMAGGAAITVITKSGTNQFKGSAFEFFMNDKMNATPYYFGTAATKPPKLPLEQNNFGGTFGGPIARNRVFFFGSVEAYKRTSSLNTFFSVPSVAMRNGDFSGALNTNGSLQTIYNPFTGNADGSARTGFSGNVIPSDMINPVSRRIIDLLYPLPNTTGIGAGGLTNNYTRSETRTVDRENYDIKLNFNRTSAHQIWGKFSFMDAVVDDLTNYLGPDPNADGDGGFTKVWSFTAGQTWTLRPTLLLDTTFGFARQKQDVLGPDFNAGNWGLDVLGIPGTNDQGFSGQTFRERYAGYPVFNTGLSAVGNRDGWNPIFRDERTYSLAANVSKLAGRHDLRGGYSVNFLYLDHWQPESNNPRGNFSFAGNATALRGGQTANFYNTFAAFTMGLTSTVAKSVQNELMTGREWQHALYFRDRWNVNPKLTLDLGLRWEYYPLMTRADGRGLERLDLDTLEMILGGRGGNPKSVGLEAGKDNFAPRVGAIYRLNDNTVFRTGYGITYNAMGWARPMRGDLNYPITIFSSFTQPEQFLWYNTLDEGIPLIVGPDQSTGRVPLPNTAGIATPEPGNIDRGLVQTWNVAFERRLPWDLSVDVAYVGAKGTGGYAWVDLNLPQTYGGGAASRPYFISDGRQLSIQSWGQRLDTRYDSLQVSLNKAFTEGLMFKGAYTLSEAMNEADNDGRTGLSWEHPLEQYRNWALAGFDRTHNFQLGFAWALPWQSSGSYESVAKAILGDWQLNGVFGAFSGTPFTVTASGTQYNTPGTTQTADLVGTFSTTGDIGSVGPWFDRNAFAQPTGVRQGTTERNEFRGPGAWNMDLSVFRSFAMGGSRRLEFRVQGNNIFNHPVFANPQGNVTSGTFGQITSILGGGGLTNSVYIERQIQLGVRFQF